MGADDFEVDEWDTLTIMKKVYCLLLRSVIENHDDGAARIKRDGQVRYRVERIGKTVMTSLGAIEYRRPRYRRDGASVSIIPVDESLGLVNGCLTRTAAILASGRWVIARPGKRKPFSGRWGP